jgi:hypothetical protein
MANKGKTVVIAALDGTFQRKGHIKSEWIYEIINFPKNDSKNSKDFCPI